jgi:hypothetical protein
MAKEKEVERLRRSGRECEGPIGSVHETPNPAAGSHGMMRAGVRIDVNVNVI